jgi:hypothetical protein
VKGKDLKEPSGSYPKIRRCDMSTIEPKGERVRQAVKWISEMRKEEEGRSLRTLIGDASQRYNLSPKEEAFLQSFYEEETGL